MPSRQSLSRWSKKPRPAIAVGVPGSPELACCTACLADLRRDTVRGKTLGRGNDASWIIVGGIQAVSGSWATNSSRKPSPP